MKPARFDYYDPTTLAEALSLLAQFGDTAKPLAGGQSLVPMMNMRLARPAQLVDLNRLGELNYLKVEQGELRIGAMTRQRALERSKIVADGWPLLQEATRYIGHVQIRNRGTVGGSLVHAYPSAELPVVMTALEATLVLRSEKARTTGASGRFFCRRDDHGIATRGVARRGPRAASGYRRRRFFPGSQSAPWRLRAHGCRGNSNPGCSG